MTGRWWPDRRGWADLALLVALCGLALAGSPRPSPASPSGWSGCPACSSAPGWCTWPGCSAGPSSCPSPRPCSPTCCSERRSRCASRPPPTRWCCCRPARLRLEGPAHHAAAGRCRRSAAGAAAAAGPGRRRAGLARRGLTVTATRRGFAAAVLPVVVPTALLAAVILLGVREPASLWLQGAAFAALAAGLAGAAQPPPCRPRRRRPARRPGARHPCRLGRRADRPRRRTGAAGRHLVLRDRRPPAGAARPRRAALRRRPVPLAPVVLPPLRRAAEDPGPGQPLRHDAVHRRGRRARHPGADRGARRLRRGGLGREQRQHLRRPGRGHLPAGVVPDLQPRHRPDRRGVGDAGGGVVRGVAAHGRGAHRPRLRGRACHRGDRDLPLQPGHVHRCRARRSPAR